MRKLKYFIPLLFACGLIRAQVGSLGPVVIGSCGGFSTTTNFSISSNTGEVMVRTTSAPTLTLTEGFEQPSGIIDSTASDCGVVFYHGVTPNGDGHNDYWVIDYIDLHPENTVEIFDRWGTLVWKGTNYNNKPGDAPDQVAFEGKDLNDQEVTDGTYFYIFHTATCPAGDKGWIEVSGQTK